MIKLLSIFINYHFGNIYMIDGVEHGAIGEVSRWGRLNIGALLDLNIRGCLRFS